MISSSYIELYSINKIIVYVAKSNKEKEILKRYYELNDFGLIKEKSWSVRIVEGHLQEGKIRAKQCSQCKHSCDLVAIGRGNSNSLLYGCAESKCRHVLIHVEPSSASNQ